MCVLPLSAWMHCDHSDNKRAIEERCNNKVDGGCYYLKEVPLLSVCSFTASPGDEGTNSYFCKVITIRRPVEAVGRLVKPVLNEVEKGKVREQGEQTPGDASD